MANEENLKPFEKGGIPGRRPEAQLSKRPAQIRNRIRRAHKKQDRDIELLSEVTAFKPVEEWDNEELSRGRCRNASGNFTGRVPLWITPKVREEARKRLEGETLGKLAMELPHAIKVVKQLMVDEEVDHLGRPVVSAKTKLDAAKWLIETFIGKATQQVKIGADPDTLRSMLAGALVLDDGTMAHPVIDGEVTEDEGSGE